MAAMKHLGCQQQLLNLGEEEDATSAHLISEGKGLCSQENTNKKEIWIDTVQM